LGKNGKNYRVFELKRGVSRKLSPEELEKMISSVEKDLSDAFVAFCC